jgi:hypothetical protein
MGNLRSVLLLGLIGVSFARVPADDEAKRKPESEEAALKFLEEARQSIGATRRFDIECVQSIADEKSVVQDCTHIRAYFEESVGFLVQCRPIEQQIGIAGHSERWLLSGGVVTVIDDTRKTYRSVKVEGDANFSDWPFLSPHQIIPPWLDPSVDGTLLRSRYRIESARSTQSEFSIELVPRKSPLPWRLFGDGRLFAKKHQLWIDRKTHRPTKWQMMSAQDQEFTYCYTRLELNPPRREFKVSLAGYEDESPRPPVVTQSAPEQPTTMDALEISAKLLWRLLF